MPQYHPDAEPYQPSDYSASIVARGESLLEFFLTLRTYVNIGRLLTTPRLASLRGVNSIASLGVLLSPTIQMNFSIPITFRTRIGFLSKLVSERVIVILYSISFQLIALSDILPISAGIFLPPACASRLFSSLKHPYSWHIQHSRHHIYHCVDHENIDSIRVSLVT